MKIPKYVILSMQDGLNAGINMFGLQLMAESFADDYDKFKDENLLVRLQDHKHRDVWMVMSKAKPEVKDFEVDDDTIGEFRQKIAALESQLAGCKQSNFEYLTSEFHAIAKAERLEELYKSACTVSEQRRQELASFKALLPEIKEAIQCAIEQCDLIVESEERPDTPDSDQSDEWHEEKERGAGFLALYKKLEEIA